MKALVLRSIEKLEVMDVPMPALQPGLVMVKVSKCGVCGSDIRYFHGENPWAKQTLQKEVPNPPNIILGHELTGRVVDVHDASDRHLIGKRVGVNSFITCGRCRFCRIGLENLCRQTRHLGHGQGWGKMDFYPGGMAEYCPAFASQVYELTDRVTDEQATFLDPIIAAMHAVDVAGPRMLDQAAIQGAGPIGLLIVQFMKLHGARTVAISDIADVNLEVAKAVGADHVVNVADGKQSLLDAVMKATGGLGAEGLQHGRIEREHPRIAADAGQRRGRGSHGHERQGIHGAVANDLGRADHEDFVERVVERFPQGGGPVGGGNAEGRSAGDASFSAWPRHRRLRGSLRQRPEQGHQDHYRLPIVNALSLEIKEAKVAPGSLRIWWIGQEGFVIKSPRLSSAAWLWSVGFDIE